MAHRKFAHPGRRGLKRHDLINVLNRAWLTTGKVPTSRDADAGLYGLPSTKAFSREFGSFNAALEATGLPTSTRGGHNRKVQPAEEESDD